VKYSTNDRIGIAFNDYLMKGFAMDGPNEIEVLLKTIPWFNELKPEHFEKLAKIASLHQYPEGGEVFREGDRQDYLFIVLEGRVALEIFIPHQGRVRILTAEPMGVIGWSSVTPFVRQRTASARAILPSKLIGLNAEAMRQMCDEDHDLGYVVMLRIANIIASRLTVTRLQLLDMFAAPTAED
jgi:CRP/FNR family cyclic AMP-dependent transcriptional regulator